MTTEQKRLLQHISDRIGGPSGLLAILGVIAVALEFGFHKPVAPRFLPATLQWSALLGFVVSFFQTIRRQGLTWRTISRHWTHLAFFALLYAILMLLENPITTIRAISTAYVGIVWLCQRVASFAGFAGQRLHKGQSTLRPEKLLVTSFAIVIIIGGIALALPRATTDQLQNVRSTHPIEHTINAMFTATSATCVTGLTVYDTENDFTLFGQVVILILIQAGGLGIMVFGSLFGLLTGRKLSLRESLVLQDALSHQTIGQLRSMVRFIIVATFAFEIAGAIILYPMWPDSITTVSQRAFYSLFHAVSAFCNAGFALQSDSLIQYNNRWQIYTSIMPLIVIGGLGFPVISELHTRFRSRNQRPRKRRRPWSLHTRLVLYATPVLIVVPAILILIFESNHVTTSATTEGQAILSDLPWFTQIPAAIFRSVTTRTAGFNVTTLNPDAQSTGTTFLMCVLMFIGGSPASTAGGVKTVSVFVLAIAVFSTLRRRPHAEFAHRTIPEPIVRRAATVVFVMFTIVTTVTLVLCLTESASLEEILFESVSAGGTVGLTLGLTPKLTLTGRIVIMAAMFAGRLGPLSILVALAGRHGTDRYTYPSEQVIIG